MLIPWANEFWPTYKQKEETDWGDIIIMETGKNTILLDFHCKNSPLMIKNMIRRSVTVIWNILQGNILSRTILQHTTPIKQANRSKKKREASFTRQMYSNFQRTRNTWHSTTNSDLQLPYTTKPRSKTKRKEIQTKHTKSSGPRPQLLLYNSLAKMQQPSQSTTHNTCRSIHTSIKSTITTAEETRNTKNST